MIYTKFIYLLITGIPLLAIIPISSVFAQDDSCKNASNAIFNLSWEMHQEFNKTKSAQAVMDKFGTEFQKKSAELERIFKRNPACKKSFDDGVGSEARFNLRELMADLSKGETDKKSAAASPEVVSYDEWFTLQSTGVKSGKKYSFVGCVLGPRNATAIRCHTPGTAAKRVFYNPDDIQDQEMKRKWVNTNNIDMCVTAYVTGGEAFIVSIKDQTSCK